ncbi:CTLH domain-containing protein [Mycena chlorophos]|uniref:CTLH domain-containing protein n=1 Tax=Mycena chlorophos TaxID=658473 RepID=A0A8H6WNM5_MYCCL|nr:CTLH domain-containing protein [Mycena chlorophos]
MPTTSRGDKLQNYVRSATSVLDDLSSSSSIPYLKPIVGIIRLILDSIRATKAQSDINDSLLELIHEILCAITELCAIDPATDDLPPHVLQAVGEFASALQQFATVLQFQRGQSRIRRMLKSSENATILGQCKQSLSAISTTFSLYLRADLLQETARLEIDTEERHKRLLDLLATQHDRSSNDTSSSSGGMLGRGGSSTSLLSLLPSQPSIFHGRDAELAHLVRLLTADVARIAILGAGGMGKTALATVVLHHPDVQGKYSQRHFVGCEVANTADALIVAVASTLGIEKSKDARRAILRVLAQASAQTLLVLDNFETAWEVPTEKNEVEEMLSNLSELPNLSLVVTMRGAERPGKVLWSRPHLPPLLPLSQTAARDVFFDIADDPDSTEDAESLGQMLEIADNLPLALHLLANLVSVEGYTSALRRWEAEQTRILSDGYDKRSSLEMSLEISLSSPRLAAVDGAAQLLGLLSILPNGVSDTELLASAIPDPHACRQVLLRTALAHVDRGRLRVLAPVRSYVFSVSPPSFDIIRPLRGYYCQLIALEQTVGAQPDDHLNRRVLAILGNVSALITICLDAIERGEFDLEFDIEQTLTGAIRLDTVMLNLLNNTGFKAWRRVARCAESLRDNVHIRVAYFTHLMAFYGETLTPEDVENSVREISGADLRVEDQAALKLGLSRYHLRHTTKHEQALQLGREALVLAKMGPNVVRQLDVWTDLITLTGMIGRHRDNLAVLREIEALVNDSGHLKLIADVTVAKAAVYNDLGYLSLAAALCLEARHLYAACGLEHSGYIQHLLDTLADVYFQKTEYTESRAIHLELARQTSPARSPLFHATANANIALIDILAQAPEEPILSHLEIARGIFEKHNFPWGLRLCDIRMADLYLRRGDRRAARDIYQRLLAAVNLTNTMRVWCLSKFASPELGLDSLAPPSRWPALYLAHARKVDDIPKIADALRCFGDMFLAEGDVGTATRLFELALERFTLMDVHRERATCLSRLAEIRGEQGDTSTARVYLEQARALYTRSSQQDKAELTESLLKSLAATDVETSVDSRT